MNKPGKKLSKRKELDLLKEKLSISQSLIKLGFWEFNSHNRQISLSEESLEILGLSNERTTITIEEFVEIIGENQRTWFYDIINKIGDEINNLDFELLLNSQINNIEKWIRIIANTSMHSIKNPDLIIGIMQDISEQKNNEKLLKQAKERAEEADFLKSAFLANMSHEIRTPLNAILGFSQLLTNPDIPNNQRNEYSQYITSSANNLLNLVRDIIDVSKIEAGKMIIEKKNCEVNRVLKELKYTFEKEKENQSKNHIEIRLNKTVLNDDFSIVTDPFRFHQIMVNLIGNALKFIENGYIEFGYKIINQEFIEFYVKDTGIGIPNDKIDLIFSRFGQIVNNTLKNPGGTGLGLSITKHLVERLGGKIWMDSLIGHGTTFYFTLPFIQSDSKMETNHTVNKSLDEFKFKNLRILAVEDDLINMVLLEDLLKLEIKDLVIEKAFDGNEAIGKLEKSDFDLIIMDVRMPKMNGYETTKYIRHNFSYPKNQIPILGLSAHALKDEIEKGKQIGMSDFLSKPIVVDELITKIKLLISGRSANIENDVKKDGIINPQSDTKVIDINFLEKLLKNDIEKIKRTLNVYIEQVPIQLNELTDSCNEGNNEKLHNISHSFKSTFKYLGRIDLSELARQIERDIDPNDEKELILKKIQFIKNEWELIDSYIRNKYFE